jgi:hypothetical protein
MKGFVTTPTCSCDVCKDWVLADAFVFGRKESFRFTPDGQEASFPCVELSGAVIHVPMEESSPILKQVFSTLETQQRTKDEYEAANQTVFQNLFGLSNLEYC